MNSNEQSATPAQSSGFSLAEFTADVSSAPKAPTAPQDAAETPSGTPNQPENSPPPAETAPENASKAPETPAPEDNSDPAQASKNQGKKPSSRDYSGLDPSEIPLFRQMSNAAYATLYPKYLASKKLQAEFDEFRAQADAVKDKQFYEMPDAWTLHPEYKNHELDVKRLSGERDYWTEQLAKVRAGEPYNPLGMDSNGNYTQLDPVPASPRAEADIIANLNQAQLYAQSSQQRLDEFSKNFQGRHSKLSARLTEIDKSLFGNLDEKFNPVVENVLKNFPAEVRNRIEFKMLAKANVIIKGLYDHIKDLEKGAKISAAVSNTAKSAGPSTNGSPAAKGQAQDGDQLWNVFKTMTRSGR